jgi:predicted nucleic acid-binding protein
MSETRSPAEIVINTGPLLALHAALEGFEVLDTLYRSVHVPLEVQEEVLYQGERAPGADAFLCATFLDVRSNPVKTSPYLQNVLDRGEASVIQLALDDNLETVCIDEPKGRRVARLSGLRVTGSLGILLRAKREGQLDLLKPCIERMRERGIWISDALARAVLERAGE